MIYFRAGHQTGRMLVVIIVIGLALVATSGGYGIAGAVLICTAMVGMNQECAHRLLPAAGEEPR